MSGASRKEKRGHRYSESGAAIPARNMINKADMENARWSQQHVFLIIVFNFLRLYFASLKSTLGSMCTIYAYVLVSQDLAPRILFPTKILWDPLVLWSTIFRGWYFLVPTDPLPPHISLKMPKCANFSILLVSGEKNHLKVGVHCEKCMLGLYHFFFGEKSSQNFFTFSVIVTVVRQRFSKCAKIIKILFF